MKNLLSKSIRRSLTLRNSYLHTPGDNVNTRVTLLPGVGIGPEITNSVKRIFETAQVPIDFDIIKDFDFSETSHRQQLKKNKYLLLGNIGGIKS